MSNNNLKFVTNNVKGLQSTHKRLKMFEYFRNVLSPNGIIFLQETHSSINDEKNWCDEFKGELFFSHEKTNSCGIAIGYFGSQQFTIESKMTDNGGQILVLEASLEDKKYILINIYNSNTESEQIETLEHLNRVLNTIDYSHEKHIILGGDLNIFFDSSLEASGGNPTIKKKSLRIILAIKERLDLCDIWRIRNPKTCRYTFRQNHSSGVIQRRLDYFFILNNMQEFVSKTDILASFLSDHSPVFFTSSDSALDTYGKGLWKFNSSLIENEEYVSATKKHIMVTIKNFEKENINDDQILWEFLKYEIRNFTIMFTKKHAKTVRKEKEKLENELKILEDNLNQSENLNRYNDAKFQLDNIYNKIAEGIKVRSKCNWYEFVEKSSKFFLNLEKKNAIQGTICKLLVDNNDVTSSAKINEELHCFYKSLYAKKSVIEGDNVESLLNALSIPKLKIEDVNICEGNLSESELFDALTSMQNNKSPGNDGITKEFYETFWKEIKGPFQNSIKKGYLVGKLSISQRQAITKLIEKKERDKRFAKNWHPISLLNVDLKIISKVLATRIKKVISSLISSNQIAYVYGRFISEGGRLISDILEICDTLKIEGFLLTVDIEKAFDSVDHSFLIKVLQKFGFGKDFIRWIGIILKNQESCVINGGTTTNYFKLERGARQGDPISAYLFILVLEIVFLMIKNNDRVKGLELFNHTFLYTAYADDTTFFLKNKESVLEVMKTFQMFSEYSGLRLNTTKCEIAGLGVLKGVKTLLCGMVCIDLTKETIKILGIHYSYNKHIQVEKNFYDHVKAIETVLKVWRMRNLTLQGKITIFKTLAISKIVHLALVLSVPSSVIKELNKIQQNFIWSGKNSKIKHGTLCNDYENGGLKNIDIESKMISLRCS